MITNKHRNVYKVVKNNFSKERLTTYQSSVEEYELCIQLCEMDYLEKVHENGSLWFKPKKDMERKQREKAYKFIVVDDNRIPIIRCEKPKFGGKGRNWQTKIHNIENIQSKIYVDVNWGNYIYLPAKDDRWYKINLYPEWNNLENEININIYKLLIEEEYKNIFFK